MQCPQCGLSLEDGAAFCPTCGWVRGAAPAGPGAAPASVSQATGLTQQTSGIAAAKAAATEAWTPDQAAIESADSPSSGPLVTSLIVLAGVLLIELVVWVVVLLPRFDRMTRHSLSQTSQVNLGHLMMAACLAVTALGITIFSRPLAQRLYGFMDRGSLEDDDERARHGLIFRRRGRSMVDRLWD
jgi:hypothetical protein